MIETLTQAQIEKFPTYVKKWTERGLTTVQRTSEDAIRDFTLFQENILKKTPLPVVLLKSPLECNKKIKELTCPDMKSGEFQCVYPYFDCQYWAGWFSFYDYMEQELGIKYDNKKNYDIMKSCQSYGMVFPLDTICIVCQPPTIIKTNSNGLHCENGVALSYNGDNELYALNGVIMSKELVMTPAHDITTNQVFKETNVDIRRELIRKVGIAQILDKLPHKILDSDGDYVLYSIDLSAEVKDARYLKMTNPSIGVFHIEAVGPEIATVKDAKLWRNENMFADAEILT